jgi:NO-binding membrane sensor protein with MHYT domain
MSISQRIAVGLLTVIFVFFTLLSLMPEPSHADGDHRGYWAIIAALAAGVVVVAIA